MTTGANKIRKVLFINPFGIGDVIFTTPLVRAIRENCATSYIGYLCNKRTAPLFKANPAIDEVFLFEKDDYRALWRKSKWACIKRFLRLLASIKKRQFDLAIDLSLGKHYSFFCWLIGIKRRCGFNYKKRGFFLTEKVKIDGYDDKHVVEYYLDLIRFLKLDCRDTSLDVYIPAELKVWADELFKQHHIRDTDTVIGIIPGAGASWGKDAHVKQWPQEKFAQVADRLADKFKAKVLLLGDKKDAALCENMFDRMVHKPTQLCGKTDLMQFAALVNKCNLVITNDGGPLHIAVALGRKNVSIFGPVDDKVYGPYPKSKGSAVVKKGLPCQPCYRKFRMPDCQDRRCLTDLSVEAVLREAQKLL